MSSSFLLRSVVILGAIFICLSGARVTPPRRQVASTTVVSPAQIASLKPFSFYANAGYCQPSQILNWTCGGSSFITPTGYNETRVNALLWSVSCKANPTFQPIAAGGDGVDVQFWYVGIDPTLQVRCCTNFVPYAPSWFVNSRRLSSHTRALTPPKCNRVIVIWLTTWLIRRFL